MIEFCRSQHVQRTPFSGPIRDLNLGAARSQWAQVLTPEERVRSLDILASRLVKYGYESPLTLRDQMEITARRRDSVTTSQIVAENDALNRAHAALYEQAALAHRLAEQIVERDNKIRALENDRIERDHLRSVIAEERETPEEQVSSLLAPISELETKTRQSEKSSLLTQLAIWKKYVRGLLGDRAT